jgi:hypothetical protein
MVDKRGKRTNTSEEEIVGKVLSNRQTDDYQQNKIQKIKVKKVTTTETEVLGRNLDNYGEKQYREHKIIL